MELQEYKVKNKYQVSPTPGRSLDPTIITIPDQSLSIKEILNRYARGLAPANIVQSCDYDYDGDVDISEIDNDFVFPTQRQNKDLSDQEQLEYEAQQLKQKLQSVGSVAGRSASTRPDGGSVAETAKADGATA